jgi:hypothetical protein
LGSGNWAASSCTATGHTGIMEISSERAFHGSKSLKLTYIGHDPIKTCFIDQFFGGFSDTIYTRIYMFLDNFAGDGTNTKIWSHSHAGHYPAFWWSITGASNTFQVAIEGTTLGTGANIRGGVIPSGRWVCVEARATLGTPGGSDGIVQSWVDGVLQINRMDLPLRRATNVIINGTNTNGPDSHLRHSRFYRQWGQGVIYFDRFAASRDGRIGCLGAASTDKTPPAAPSDFVAN